MSQHQVRIYETGTPAVMKYEELAAAVGAPSAGQVRLKQEAIGINFIDTLFRRGLFNAPLPLAMGVEAAGVVEAVGEGVVDIEVGDRVAYFFSPGAYADERLIDASVLVRLPKDITSEQGATLLTKGLTAWMLVKRVHQVQPGQTVLVHGAAGGVGSLVATWAKSLGATVIATVGSPEKTASVHALGIEHVLSTNDPAFEEKVSTITLGKGVDVVYEFVGKATFALSLAVLRDGGTLAHAGNASGAPSQDDKAPLQARGIRYVQPGTAQYVGNRESLEAASADVFAAYRSGIFGKAEAKRYRLADAVQAHEDIEARRITGAAIFIP